MPKYDAAVIGAGPVGCVCAIVLARKGVRVALLEANPNVSKRLAGEWLHPPAVRLLRDVGIDVDTLSGSKPGVGFVVLPDDGSDPILLPYPDGSPGLVCDHELLVSSLREVIENEADVDFISHARVNAVENERLTFTKNGSECAISADRIIGADGRASIVRRSLGYSMDPMLCSRMLGVTLPDADLLFEGYGHVILGGPGPIFIYGLANGSVRINLDVPLDCWNSRDRISFLSESYGGLLPEYLGQAFVEALHDRRFHAAANQLRPRVTYGARGFARKRPSR